MAKELAELLRKGRIAAGLTQKEVAEALGYSTPQFVSNWERGSSGPPLKQLKKLGKLYRISPDALYKVILDDTLARVEASLRREFYGVGRKKA